MGDEIPSGGSARRDKAATVRPTQVVRSSAPAPWTHEVRIDDGRVLVTVSCPEVDEDSLRYAIGRRYVLVWSQFGPKATQHFVLLPKPVDPKDQRTAFRNGVFDLSIAIRPHG